jgi:hypothetical protein
MIRNVHSLLLVLFVVLPFITQAQQNDALLKLYFDDVRAGKYPAIPKTLSFPENAKRTLTLVEPYTQDTVSSVRYKAYSVVHVTGNSSRQPTIRETAVTQLVNACKDKDAGIVGQALSYLTSYNAIDFTTKAKGEIRNLFNQKPAHFDQLIKLVGFLELADMVEVIRPYTLPGNAQSIRWAAIVSLARLNDPLGADEMMRRAKKLPVNDDLIYKIFPDLAYSRYPAAINYMIEVMGRDDKDCLSADAEKEAPIVCGYRIMEQLATVVESYPVQLDASGDIKSKDYVAALATVREWFAKHTDYKIRHDNY